MIETATTKASGTEIPDNWVVLSMLKFTFFDFVNFANYGRFRALLYYEIGRFLKQFLKTLILRVIVKI